MNQRCDQAWSSIDTVEETQMLMMEAMGEAMRRIQVLKDHNALKEEWIGVLEARVE